MPEDLSIINSELRSKTNRTVSVSSDITIDPSPDPQNPNIKPADATSSKSSTKK